MKFFAKITKIMKNLVCQCVARPAKSDSPQVFALRTDKASDGNINAFQIGSQGAR